MAIFFTYAFCKHHQLVPFSFFKIVEIKDSVETNTTSFTMEIKHKQTAH